jgi:hypothetical protein
MIIADFPIFLAQVPICVIWGQQPKNKKKPLLKTLRGYC